MLLTTRLFQGVYRNKEDESGGRSEDFKRAVAALDEVLAEDEDEKPEDSEPAAGDDQPEEDPAPPDGDDDEPDGDDEDQGDESDVTDDDAGDDEEPEESPKKKQPAKSTIPDDLAALAASYGIPATELAGRSEAEVRYAISVIDRQVQNQGRDWMDRLRPKDGGVQDGSETKPAAKETPEKESAAGDSKPEEKVPTELTEESIQAQLKRYRDAGFEDEVVEVLEGQLRMIAAQSAENARLRGDVGKINGILSSAQAAANQRERQAARERDERDIQGFLQAVDSLGEPELFGEPGKKLSEGQLQNISQIYQEIMVRRAGLAAMGMSPALTPQLASRVFQQSFPDHVAKKAEKNRSEKIRKQSKRVMGRGTPAQGRKDVPFDGDVVDDPVIREWAQQHGLHA